MSQTEAKPKRYIGLDDHKHYLVAAGVDPDQNQVMAPVFPRHRMFHILSPTWLMAVRHATMMLCVFVSPSD